MNNNFKLKGEEVSLREMLMCREKRVNIQDYFLEKYNCTLISFCMNIPGPVKTNEKINKVFKSGLDKILSYLKNNEIEILESKTINEKTGDEFIAAVKCNDSKIIKEAMVEIEEKHPLGRLFDIDVLDKYGNKMSRKNFRKCFMCNKQAQECASTRRHSVEEMQEYLCKIIDEFLKK